MDISPEDIEALERILHMAQDAMVTERPQAAPEGQEQAPPPVEEPESAEHEQMEAAAPMPEEDPEEEEALASYRFAGGAVKPRAPMPPPPGKQPVRRR